MRRWGRRLALAIDGLVICSALSVIGALWSREHWFLDVLSQFLLPSLWFLVAAPVLLVALMIAAGASVRHGLAGLTAIIALTAGAPVVHDPPVSLPEGAVRLSVYQHNIYVENIVIDRIIETVEREDPDIIALVEVRDDMMAPWESRLMERWPHMSKARSSPDGYARLRFFSKYPILEFRVRKRDNEPATLRARLDTPAGEVTVIVVHFTRPWPFQDPPAQMRHYRALEPMIDAVDGPLLVLGDFNSAPWGRLGRRMIEDKGFQLANRRAVGTWPGRVNIDDVMNTLGLPRSLTIPIDLAFCRGGLVCTGHEVGENLGSDHRYALFDIWIPPDPATGSEPR